jgi:hypothetical protein
VAIVEAVAETMRGDVNEKAMDKFEDLVFLATEVRNAATAIEVVSNDNVSRLISGSTLSSCVSPQFLERGIITFHVSSSGKCVHEAVASTCYSSSSIQSSNSSF